MLSPEADHLWGDISHLPKVPFADGYLSCHLAPLSCISEKEQLQMLGMWWGGTGDGVVALEAREAMSQHHPAPGAIRAQQWSQLA